MDTGPSCHAGLVILEIGSPFLAHVPEVVRYRQFFVCSPPLCAVPVRCALDSFLLGHGFRGGGFQHAATDAVQVERTARPDAGGGLRSGRFCVRARCVAPVPPVPACAPECRVAPRQPVAGLPWCCDGPLHIGAVPLQHRAPPQRHRVCALPRCAVVLPLLVYLPPLAVALRCSWVSLLRMLPRWRSARSMEPMIPHPRDR